MADSIYLGNPLLKKANTPIEYTQEQILELSQCAEDPVYFTKNYIKIVSVDHGLVNFNMWPFQEKLVNNFHENRFNICLMPRQVGKKLSLDTPIPTPTGWTTMGEVKIGDKIFGRNGKAVEVIAKSEVHEIDTYEVEFDNGEVIKACSKHLWKVSHSDWYHKEKVLTTKEIITKFESLKNVSKGSSVYVNITDPIIMPEVDLPIDPYTFGVWLGDGCKVSSQVVGVYEDIESISENIPYEIIKRYNIKDSRDNKSWKYTYKDLKEKLRKFDFSNGKYIPDIYLRSSIQQRLELLRGLMDTDGSVDPKGCCEFYQKEGKLFNQVRELISSLGIKSRISYKKVKDYPANYGTIRFTTTKFVVFKLPRKLERQRNCKNHPKNTRLYIKDIRRIATEPMQCLSVNDPDHMFLCGETFIPTHNSTTVVSYLLHYLIFNHNVTIGILANKASTSRELLSRLQLAYENLPKWMQQGIISWNKGSLELENGSKIIAASTSASAVRGMTFNIIFLDEFAFVPNHIADQFFASVYPTISSGKSTKVIIVSTPRGMNFFYKMWHDANLRKNEFVPTEVHWSEVPGRDEEWKKQTIQNIGEAQFRAEYLCEFLGSVDTLIAPAKLKTLAYDHPIKRNKGLDIHEEPIKDHNYIIAVDVARGVEKDYSAFTVIDISIFPHKLVAKYRNNQIKPMLFPSVIHETAQAYNKAFIICEVNDIGDQVASIIHYDLEYSNLLMCSMRGRAGQSLGQGFSGKKTQLGVKMSKNVKKIGCMNLKTLIEEDKLLLSDYEVISELTTFIQKNNSFEAEQGSNDDLVSCLVIYAWMVAQDYFKELTEQDVRKRIYEENKDQIEQDMAPFGFIMNGVDDQSFIDVSGDRWYVDEYGDKQAEFDYMWQYL